MAQVQTVIADTDLSLKKYAAIKIVTALSSGLLCSILIGYCFTADSAKPHRIPAYNLILLPVLLSFQSLLFVFLYVYRHLTAYRFPVYRQRSAYVLLLTFQVQN